MMKSILVTGGYGFIGSRMCARLESRGLNFDIADDMSFALYSSRSRASTPRVNFGAVSNPALLSRISAGYYDTIFHFAAWGRVGSCTSQPIESHAANVTSTLQLLDACARVDGTKPTVIVSSSSAVYGNAQSGELGEDGPVGPISLYGHQKLTVEGYCRLYSETHGVPTVCLRYFNVYGNGQLARGPYTTVMAAWIDAALNGRALRWDGDGEQRRDYVNVEDVIDANLRAAQNPTGRIYNVGTGFDYSNSQLRAILGDHGISFDKIVAAPARVGDPAKTCANIDRIKQDLGWEPKILLREGLKNMVVMANMSMRSF